MPSFGYRRLGDRDGEAVRLDGADHDRHDLADAIRCGFGMNALQIGAAADQLAGMPPRLFEQHRQDTPQAAFVEGALLSLQHGLQRREPLRLDRLRYLVGGSRRRRSRPRRVFEREGLREADLRDEMEGRPEIIVALARIADDEI